MQTKVSFHVLGDLMISILTILLNNLKFAAFSDEP